MPLSNTSFTYIIQGDSPSVLNPFFSSSKAGVIQNLVIEHFKYTYKDYIGVLEFFSGTRGVCRSYKLLFFKWEKPRGSSTVNYLVDTLYEHFEVLEDLYKKVLSY